MSIRVWKYLDEAHKQLIDLVTSNNLDFMIEMYNTMCELYNYYNYEIEKRGF